MLACVCVRHANFKVMVVVAAPGCKKKRKAQVPSSSGLRLARNRASSSPDDASFPRNPIRDGRGTWICPGGRDLPSSEFQWLCWTHRSPDRRPGASPSTYRTGDAEKRPPVVSVPTDWCWSLAALVRVPKTNQLSTCSFPRHIPFFIFFFSLCVCRPGDSTKGESPLTTWGGGKKYKEINRPRGFFQKLTAVLCRERSVLRRLRALRNDKSALLRSPPLRVGVLDASAAPRSNVLRLLVVDSLVDALFWAAARWYWPTGHTAAAGLLSDIAPRMSSSDSASSCVYPINKSIQTSTINWFFFYYYIFRSTTDPFGLFDAWNLPAEQLVDLRQIWKHGQLIRDGQLGHFVTSSDLSQKVSIEWLFLD